MRPSEEVLCYLIGHMAMVGVVLLFTSLPGGGQPEVLQEYLIPIYQMGDQWLTIILLTLAG